MAPFALLKDLEVSLVRCRTKAYVLACTTSTEKLQTGRQYCVVIVFVDDAVTIFETHQGRVHLQHALHLHGCLWSPFLLCCYWHDYDCDGRCQLGFRHNKIVVALTFVVYGVAHVQSMQGRFMTTPASGGINDLSQSRASMVWSYRLVRSFNTRLCSTHNRVVRGVVGRAQIPYITNTEIDCGSCSLETKNDVR